MDRSNKNFAEAIRRRLAADPDLAAAVEEERLNANIATELYAARKAAGLTQQGLAAMLGTHQPVVARLEDADYDAHSLTMLKRVAAALNKRLQVRFVDPVVKQVSGSIDLTCLGAEWNQSQSAWTPKIEAHPGTIPFTRRRQTAVS